MLIRIINIFYAIPSIHLNKQLFTRIIRSHQQSATDFECAARWLPTLELVLHRDLRQMGWQVAREADARADLHGRCAALLDQRLCRVREPPSYLL